MLAICILLFQALAAGATIERFGDGSSSAFVGLAGAGGETVLNITLPADCLVLGAAMKVSSAVSSSGKREWPANVSVLVGGSTVWQFDAAGYGPLGRQDSFPGGERTWSNTFGPDGGANATSLRLPSGAEVRSAAFEASGTGPRVPAQRFSMSGNIMYGFFGSSVSAAGDVNGDGLGDVIAGAPNAGMGNGNMETGYAALYFGGPDMGASMDRYFHGPVEWGHMGASVSGAGDVNGDGFDDIIVGADEYVTNDIGHAYIFYGGTEMDIIADVTAGGEAKFDQFGWSVSGAGDVNGDGYDDVIIGAKLHTSPFGYYAGRAHILFGGPQMDNLTDVVLDGCNTSDYFGISVSGAGDLNGDGYDDVVVGACGAMGVPNEAGYAKVFLGGKNMDSVPDLTLKGKGPGDAFGVAVSGAGDLNGDGYDDFMVGAPQNDAGGEDSGAVYIYYGGKTLDDTCDLVLKLNRAYDKFGRSLSDAGDLDNDGYDDILVGAPENQSQGSATGSSYAFFGGAQMDGRPDAVYPGCKRDEAFGASVAGAGDVDGDGWNETFIGMPRNSTIAQTMGAAAVFGWRTGLPGPSVRVGSQAVWAGGDFFNGTASSGDFPGALNAFLRSSPISGNDEWGNSYTDVPVAALACGEGALTVQNLSIIYDYTADITDFSVELNDYLSAHRAERGIDGNLTVPVVVRSVSPGRVRLHDLRITFDAAPSLVETVPDILMDEDSACSNLLCLRPFFQDDFSPARELKIGLSVLTNQSFVRVAIDEWTNISADALTGDANDNWTGEVDLVATAQDARGSVASSNRFRLIVQNVPDAPVITSVPPGAGTAGRPYCYDLTAEDGDGDVLAFELLGGPAGMTVDATGAVRWTPSKAGRHNVSLSVTDGTSSVRQDFFVDVPNSPPRMGNSSVPAAYTDSPYSLVLDFVDDNGDALRFSLLAGPEGLALGESSGRIDWVPLQAGQFPVSFSVSDGIAAVVFNLTIQVLQGNRAPAFITEPVTAAFAAVPYTCRPQAADPDGDNVTITPVEMPPGMAFNASTGALAWTPARPGVYPVRLRATDARGASATLVFNISVTERRMPSVEFLSPAAGGKLSGKVAVTGRCARGSLNITAVQLRVDNGPWKEAQGLEGWQFLLNTAGLKNGNHTLEARASDGYGWSEPVRLSVAVQNPAGRDSQPAPALAAVLVLAIVAAAAVAWMMRRRGRREARALVWD